MPLKLFQTFMSLWLKSSALVETPAQASAPVRAPPVVGPGVVTSLEDDFWISALGKLLPGTWVKAWEVTDKAAKADDAKIHTGLWDQHAVLVPPTFTCSDLELVRPCFHFLWCQKLV
jgi:hypothetical protein